MKLSVLTPIFLMLGSVAAIAQTSPADNAAPKIATQCLSDLGKFADGINDQGYWLTGWGSRWGYGVPNVAALPPVATPPAATNGKSPPPPAPLANGPWPGNAYGMMSPRFRVRALYTAAYVLADQGDEKGCQSVLSDLRSTYDRETARLQAAGLKPGEVTSWRQEQLTLAKPVAQLSGAIVSVDDLTGKDVRNPRDQLLGTIDDVIIDPKSGQIAYVVLAHGGFLGIGESYVAIPWSTLKATPGFNSLVLDVTKEKLDKAPKVNPDRFAEGSSFQQRKGQIDQYWKNKVAG